MEEDNCNFCPEPNKVTEWWYEDEVCRVMDNLSGKPMVVLNRHSVDLTENERNHIDEVVTDLYGVHNRYTLMNVITDHWHSHIREYEYEPTQPISESSKESGGDYE